MVAPAHGHQSMERLTEGGSSRALASGAAATAAPASTGSHDRRASQQRRRLREVVGLRGLERVVERRVDTPHPPAVGQPHHPPPLGLRRLPMAGEVVGVHEHRRRTARCRRTSRGCRGWPPSPQCRSRVRSSPFVCASRGEQVGQFESAGVLLASGVRVRPRHHPSPAGRPSAQLGRGARAARGGGRRATTMRSRVSCHATARVGSMRVAEVAHVVEPDAAVVTRCRLDEVQRVVAGR